MIDTLSLECCWIMQVLEMTKANGSLEVLLFYVQLTNNKIITMFILYKIFIDNSNQI